jgi:predicted DCC family thiol-disulfide oxidoreductase YuxK
MEGQKIELPILVYDDQCALCTRFAHSLKKVSGAEKINMISAHNEELYQHFNQLTAENCLSELHFLNEAEEVFTGPQAIEQLISLFPLVSKFSWLIESGMGKKALSYFYDMSNKYRESLLNRCTGCKK